MNDINITPAPIEVPNINPNDAVLIPPPPPSSTTSVITLLVALTVTSTSLVAFTLKT